ncbi:MAG: 1-(5-phosphoribosyl)-5-[(5-phosphoribosylamino)methylideneamino]imidazole-4-carboxamide isomerase [Eubacteriales bacterium]|nr:1-(5-phosphoribosyl)-5-[(5-phosphoribosylamino)methylideneamino]imidazole-4-carboxamide isomerase [Eubacteriales bacterium]
MRIYPAIDLKAGKCVRLRQGDMEQATVYGDDPAAMARGFAQAGSPWIHVVDLDGAFAGESRNRQVIAAIAALPGLSVQTGGGIRTREDIQTMLEKVGVARVILGTAAIQDAALVAWAAQTYGDRIAVGIDAKGGKVAVKGWAEVTDTDAVQLAMEMKTLGVRSLIYTDIARDGMMTGPDFDRTQELIQRTGLDVIISGGVSELAQVRRAKAIGAAGIIIGKALYTGAIALEEALREGETAC